MLSHVPQRTWNSRLRLVSSLKRFGQARVEKRDAFESRGCHVMSENTTKILPERNEKEFGESL